MKKYEKLVNDAEKYIGLLQTKTEIIPFLEWLDKEIKPQNCLEIGVYQGASFYLWSQIIPGLKLAIDLPNGRFGVPYQRTYLEMAVNKHRIELCGSNSHCFFGDSQSEYVIKWVENQLNGEKLEFLFIDGDHTYEGVKRDYNNYKKFVKDKGVIAFHDIKNSKEHAERNCEVWKLWSELNGNKLEWSDNSPDDNGHCGIGVIINEESI